MKTEKTLFQISLLETFLYFALLLIVLNVPIFIFTLISGAPRLLIYDTSWITQFLFPIGVSIIWTSINRNGFLKLTMFNDSKPLIEKIESLVLKKGYVKIGSETDTYEFVSWGRFFNYFFRENVRIEITNDEILIYSKKNVLDSIEMKLKYNKTI